MTKLSIDQAQEQGVVIGLKDVTGNVSPRKDIDWQIVNQPEAFNIFLIALWELQQEGETDNKMSYYQVAGIHGLPKALWDDVDSPQKHPDDTDQSGYCAHATLKFGTWHRPYLAMFEQTVYFRMQQVAERYSAKYQEAIKTWRLPYWDYYHARGGRATFPGIFDDGKTEFPWDFPIPKIFTVDQVMVRNEKGQLVTHPNPLSFFRFPQDGNPLHSIPEKQWQIIDPQSYKNFSQLRTYRHGGNIESLNAMINRMREPQTNTILDMMDDAAYEDFEAVGSAARTEGASGSLEGIHNKYHMEIGNFGSGGHMSSVPVAAFDPVFWFHHGQIDRWLATWQKIHPQSWFEKGSPLRQENLLPFRTQKEPKEEFWNSDQVYNTEAFGYYYEDTTFGTPDEVKAEFFRKYKWSVRRAGVTEFGKIPEDMKPLPVESAEVFQYSSEKPGDIVLQPDQPEGFISVLKDTEKVVTPIAKGDQSAVADKRVMTNIPDQLAAEFSKTEIVEEKVSRHWYLDQAVERLALNGSFATFFFIGDFEDDPTRYVFQGTLAGLAAVFSAPVEACDNCGRQREQALEVTDTTDITPLLLDYIKAGKLQSLDPEPVEKFLKENLKWRVIKSTGEKIDPRTVRGLKIGLSSKVAPMLPATGDVVYQEFPEVIRHIVANSS
ncbi:Di-copper centre-containing protein [Delitschia confertaspora ATCC 74209]|uniref:tyrosinase n=1 Tax=Delitschia confertaspora ATCC 74209 TaxID=1513339 RepID=A0A9P4JTJ6_9PLEO|nr:Di-copper centre-containing protein [Delitschia confertaspora ATCC 74209]